MAKYLNYTVTIADSVIHKKVLETSKQAVEMIKNADDLRFISSKQSRITFTTNKLARLMEEIRNLEDSYKKTQ